MSLVPDFLLYAAPAIPFLLACLVGFILALVRWRYHPGVSLLACFGLAGLALVFLVSLPLYYYLPRMLAEDGWSQARIGSTMTVINVIRAFLQAASLVLLLIAVFAGRRQAVPVLPDEEVLPTDNNGGTAFRSARPTR